MKTYKIIDPRGDKVIVVESGLTEDEAKALLIVFEATDLYKIVAEGFDNLYELTGYESGIVRYDDEAILCNWTSLKGLPRVFATGLIALDDMQDVTLKESYRIDNLAMVLDGVDLIYQEMDEETFEQEFSSPVSATVYELEDSKHPEVCIWVYVPSEWV